MSLEQIYNRCKALGSAKTKKGRAIKSTLTESVYRLQKSIVRINGKRHTNLFIKNRTIKDAENISKKLEHKPKFI